MKANTILGTLGILATTGALGAAPASAAGLTGKALADRYNECWTFFSAKNWAEFARCYAKDAVSTAPGLPEARGAAEILAKHAQPLAAAMPDVTGEPQLMLVSGNQAASVALVRGTNTGPLPGPAMPATGKKVGQIVAHAIEAHGTAAAAKEWFIMDGGTFMAQLGLSKMPARAALATGAAQPSVVIATGSASEKANLAAAKKGYALFNKHDPSMFTAMADDVVDRDQAAPADRQGKAAVSEVIKGFWQMSSKAKLDLPVMFAAGDYVVAIGRCTGVNDGDNPGMGLKKTGRKFDVDLVEITKWRQGKLVELWPFMDGAQLAMQLGLIPPPAVAVKK
jgi:predicted ester cyclase